MNLDELEEELENILPAGWSVEKDKRGQIIILTGQKQDDDGELVDFSDDEDDEEMDFDPDLEPLDEDELDDEE